MALETNTLVNGQWQLTTLNVDSVLEHYNQQEKEANVKSVAIEKPPAYGLLTQTIIRSPQAHWILPVKLRSPNANDVAFIGEDFVQIRELHPDGHLCDIIRKENFGAQIHNAKVIGSINSYNNDPDRPDTDAGADNEDVDMDGQVPPHGSHLRKWLNMPPPPGDHLPPQSLVLHLTSGDFIFMLLRQTANGGWAFVSTRRRVAKPMLSTLRPRPVRPKDSFDNPNSRALPSVESSSRINLTDLQAGIHLAVDPSSRYMAIGCSQDLFAIYELHTRESMKQQWKNYISNQTDLQHIKSERYIPIPGVIHKMEFLYPSADDEEHIILLLLVVRSGRTRMIVYEWQAGNELRTITPHSRRGHQLEESRRMPSLLIPLTIKSAFILVTEKSMAICQNILEGNPACIDFNADIEPPSELHTGLGNPLWVSWARPHRLPYHTATRDDIYIAREDGLVKFFEIDVEEFVNADMRIGHFDCNIGPAFACLDYQKYVPPYKGGDLLITSGDACNGGTYLVLARDGPALNENIPNWSPAIDFATTSPSQDRAASRPSFHKDIIPKRDRIFACSGTGLKGAITEFRYGLEASVGTIIPYDVPIMQAWIISPGFGSPDNNDGSLFLLSLADRSALIRISADASAVEAIEQDSTHLDLQHRTIAAKLLGDSVVQITDNSIVISKGDVPIYVSSGQELLGTHSSIERAIIHDNFVLFMTRFGGDCGIHLLGPLSPDPENDVQVLSQGISVRLLQTISAHTTSLNVCMIRNTPCALVASSYSDYVELIFVPITGAGSHALKVAYSTIDESINLDALISLAVAHGSSEELSLLCGTRNGFVVTLNILVTDTAIQVQSSQCDRFGAGPVDITRDNSSEASELFFVSCDSGVYAINPGLNRIPSKSSYKARSTRTIEHVWLTDALDPAMLQPAVISVSRLPDVVGSTDSGNLLVIAGEELILARLGPQPKAVPRHLSINGTPRRILYSQELDLLVVAAIVDKKSTLLFIDPDTGRDLSKPVDKNGVPVSHVTGLGRTNDKLLGLLEWPFVKDGRTWKYLVVTTSSGRVVLISYERERSPNPNPGEPTKVRYHSRFTFRHDEPINAVVGYPEGLIYCSGNTLYCEILDIVQKRFKRIAEYQLSSEARSLFYENGNIYAMTIGHSLEILQLIHSNGESAIVSTHCDQNQRTGLHHLEVGLDTQLSLVSDSDSSVTGLWATRGTKADTLDTLFEAELPHSVQRFRMGNCRPIWDPAWRVITSTRSNSKALADATNIFEDYNIIQNSKSNGEILGLSIDGSLSHHTVIGYRAWHFLRFIINLAIRSPTVCPFTHSVEVPLEPSLEPKIMMHIDGDILKRCLEEQRLEELLESTTEHEHMISVYGRFVELLQELHGGTLDQNATPQAYVNQAYSDLEFYLRPVL